MWLLLYKFVQKFSSLVVYIFNIFFLQHVFLLLYYTSVEHIKKSIWFIISHCVIHLTIAIYFFKIILSCHGFIHPTYKMLRNAYSADTQFIYYNLNQSFVFGTPISSQGGLMEFFSTNHVAADWNIFIFFFSLSFFQNKRFG